MKGKEVNIRSWLLPESKVREMLGFKNSNTFKAMREALGLPVLRGKGGRERYSIADVERCIERHFSKAQKGERNGQGN